MPLSAVQAPNDPASQGVQEEAGCGSVHDVDVRVQRRCESNNDTHADHERRISAVDGDFVDARHP